ncbi:fimbrial biogenesis outer membrane usher protein [Pseudomonas sp. S75]|uniref:fimbria/pilus outer membrane usher protein n=1 Tax=unclassified Pseudomonas TaxID=196821 RepID=UPI0019050BD3|nr:MULTISPECIES: fimbria/pilus outer membrane usher protein [unclassified Pseudomonas]MBJ9977672.1 fimbrial biogenesis outer membrane usher protein [Pseudomonas sp. S30]MBK0155044.1 fimbrial biogenesis outer membrane usher protein [Pseudomonas sp. S75]
MISPVECRTSRPRRWLLGSVALVYATLADAESAYRFDDDLLMGSSLGGGQLTRFNRADRVDPGRYHVDLYVNDHYAHRGDVEFREQGQAVQPCLTEQWLNQYLGVKAKPNAMASGCVDLPARLPGATYTLDTARLRLDLSIPQALLDLKPQGYVDPRQWNAGSSVAFANYDANVYRSRYQTSGSGQSDYGYLGLDSGLNLGLWRLRHQSNYTYSRYDGRVTQAWNSVRTYAQRAVPSLRSELTLGDNFTRGNLFGSAAYRGLRLESDDRMLPDSQRQYAPQVRGTARGNARVVISQNGQKIHETTVAPGPFLIDDLYGTAYGGDLDVQVIEADGDVSRFTVPFAAVPESIRPGLSRYSATLGQVRQNEQNQGGFAELTYQRGLNNALSANLGTRVAEDYLAILGGGVWATRHGAFGLNSTFSSARIENHQRNQGWRLGLNYSRTFQPTQTTLTLAGYRYSTEGFRDLTDALGVRRANRQGQNWDSNSFRQRNQLTLLINQALGSYGNLYLSGSSSDYYDGKSRNTQLQFGYSSTWRQLSYSLAYSRQQTTWYRDIEHPVETALAPHLSDQHGSSRTNALTLTLSMPLGMSSRAPNLTSMVASRSGDNRGNTYQTGLNGTFGQDRSTSYAVAAGHGDGAAGTDWSANLQQQGSLATVNAGYSQSDSYRQLNVGLRGAAVAHAGGVTLGPYVGDTFALVEAKGASGAVIRGGQGARVDRDGYAVVPSLTAYRYNSISLDPSGLDQETELLETERKVAPYAGAAVHVTFKTLSGHPLLIRARLSDGSSLPLGAEVFDDQGVNVGMVGQGGQVYARAEGDQGQLSVRWGPRVEDGCRLPYDIRAQAPVARQALWRLQATCTLSGNEP